MNFWLTETRFLFSEVFCNASRNNSQDCMQLLGGKSAAYNKELSHFLHPALIFTALVL